MHYTFHVNVFAPLRNSRTARPSTCAATSLPTLRGVDGGPLMFDAFLPVTFEDALAALAALPRLDAEPDGFFILAGGQGPTHWRVSGHLFDFGGRLHRVELHGDCPAESFDALLACFGSPPASLAFELVAEGVALDESAFRAWASRAPDA